LRSDFPCFLYHAEDVSDLTMAGDEPDSKKTKVSNSDISNMTSKQFLDTLVVPQLLPALTAVSTARPADPIQFLAEYLIKHKKTPDEAASEQN